MAQHNQQARAAAALAAAAAQLATAERAARNINRVRGQQIQPTHDPVNLDDLITALLSIHDIRERLGKTVAHYAQALRWPHNGYTGAFGEHMDYPRPVIDAASTAEHELTTLATKLPHPGVAFCVDAITNLGSALTAWRKARRSAGA